MKKSDTPRTDAVITVDCGAFDFAPLVEFSKELERENAVLRAALSESKILLTEDFKLLMPLISPLVDAFDGMNNDLRSMIGEQEPRLLSALEAISRALDRY